MAREYPDDLQAIQNAVRAAVSAGTRELASEDTVDGSTLVVWSRFRPGSGAGIAGQGAVRVVVQPLAPGRTAVRVFWPAAATFSGGTGGADVIFLAIESRLR
jgi:hypothetical protein